jgi:hypothetical protein
MELVTITKANRLIIFRELIAVYFGSVVKHINTNEVAYNIQSGRVLWTDPLLNYRLTGRRKVGRPKLRRQDQF